MSIKPQIHEQFENKVYQPNKYLKPLHLDRKFETSVDKADSGRTAINSHTVNRIFNMKKHSLDRHEERSASRSPRLSRNFYGPERFKKAESLERAGSPMNSYRDNSI